MLRKTLQFIIGFIVVLALVAGPLFLAKTAQFKTMGAAGAAAAAATPPTVVTAVAAKAEMWSNSLSAPGSLEAVQGVTVSAEVPGKVAKIGFEAGASVKAGDILVQLDVSAEEAQLRASEANAALAKANLDRARDLRQNNTNSPAELDAADATAKQAAAQVENIRAIIAKKTIKAPFPGRLGLRQVNLGQILREGDAITTLQTLDPIYVNFWMPQQRLSQLAIGTPVELSSDAAPGQKFSGKITAISPEVNLATRNVLAQATIPNREEKLRPGMFGNIDVLLPTQTSVLAIPVTAVIYAPFGDSVFVIEDKKDEKSGQMQQVIRQQFVRIGGTRGDFVNVVDGLKAGQMVVSAGVFKLRPGTAVKVDNKLAIEAKLNPTPENK